MAGVQRRNGHGGSGCGVSQYFRSGVGSGFAHVVLGFDLSEDRRVLASLGEADVQHADRGE